MIQKPLINEEGLDKIIFSKEPKIYEFKDVFKG